MRAHSITLRLVFEILPIGVPGNWKARFSLCSQTELRAGRYLLTVLVHRPFQRWFNNRFAVSKAGKNLVQPADTLAI